MKRRLRLRAAVAALVLLGGLTANSAPALADEGRAAASFRAGTEAFARGDYTQAARAFEDAHREAPRGAALYNAGRAWEAAGEAARAADAYDAALRMGGLADEQSTGARARLAALGASLGRLDIAAPAGASVSVAHMERAPAPLVVHVAPGQHAVRVDLPDGRTVTRSLTVAAGASASLGVEAPGAAPPSAKPKPGRGAVAVSSGGVSPQRVVAWTALGGAVVSSGAAVVLGLLTLDARDSFDEFGRRDPDLHDRAVALRTWTNVAWIGAGTLAAAGIVLLVTSPARTAASSPRSTSTPMLFGRF